MNSTKYNTPRKPTCEELEELKQLETEDSGSFEVGLIKGAAISVFDDYVNPYPGFCGKVMVVIWAMSPVIVATYIWHKGEELLQVGRK